MLKRRQGSGQTGTAKFRRGPRRPPDPVQTVAVDFHTLWKRCAKGVLILCFRCVRPSDTALRG